MAKLALWTVGIAPWAAGIGVASLGERHLGVGGGRYGRLMDGCVYGDGSG